MPLGTMGARAAPDLAVLVQRVADAGHARGIDAAMSFYAPGAVYDMSSEGMGILEGRAAIGAFFAQVLRAYDEHESELEGARAAAERLAEERGG